MWSIASKWSTRNGSKLFLEMLKPYVEIQIIQGRNIHLLVAFFRLENTLLFDRKCGRFWTKLAGRSERPWPRNKQLSASHLQRRSWIVSIRLGFAVILSWMRYYLNCQFNSIIYSNTIMNVLSFVLPIAFLVYIMRRGMGSMGGK